MKYKLLLFLALGTFSYSGTSAQCDVNLGNDAYLCNGQSVNLAIDLQYFNDSLVITYDASKGQTQLAGEPKVYMHAGAELYQFGGWQYTTGNWGMDDH